MLTTHAGARKSPLSKVQLFSTPVSRGRREYARVHALQHISFFFLNDKYVHLCHVIFEFRWMTMSTDSRCMFKLLWLNQNLWHCNAPTALKMYSVISFFVQNVHKRLLLFIPCFLWFFLSLSISACAHDLWRCYPKVNLWHWEDVKIQLDTVNWLTLLVVTLEILSGHLTKSGRILWILLQIWWFDLIHFYIQRKWKYTNGKTKTERLILHLDWKHLIKVDIPSLFSKCSLRPDCLSNYRQLKACEARTYQPMRLEPPGLETRLRYPSFWNE